MKKQWYTSPYFDETIEHDFYERLKRSRNDFNKAQYIRIQANYLLNSTDVFQQGKGLELMHLLMQLFPDDKYNNMLAHLSLGNYFRIQKRYDEAIEQFEIVRTHNKSETKGKYDIPEILIAMTIIEGGVKNRFDYALSLMQEVDKRKLFLPELKEVYDNIMNLLKYTTQ